MKLKLGIISLGSVSTHMLYEEAKKIFEEVDLIDLKKIEIKIDKETTVLYDGEVLKKYDCLYMKGSHRYSTILYGLSEIFKDKCYIPIDSNAHIIAHNKFMTHLYLSSDKSLKMPNTYFAAKISETKAFLKTLNYPKILKFPSGTHGKGVIFTESYKSASSMLDALDIFKQPLIVQDYIAVKSDIRVIVTGNKIAAAMRRIANDDDIRANLHQGAGAEPFIVTPEIKKLSIAAANKIKAKICAVDIIESDYGPLILEINSSPGLQKITEVSRKNVPGLIAKYLHEETGKYRQDKDKINNRSMMSGLGVEEIGGREIETELKVNLDRIIVPDFAYKMSDFKKGENVTIRVSKNKIEIMRIEEVDDFFAGI